MSRIPVGAGSELVDEIRRGEEFEDVKQENEKEPQGKVENKELPPSESRKITIDVQQTMAEVSQNEKYCPVCKKINKSTAKFCAGCGYDFSEERICKECGNKIRPGKKFCSACGAKVED